jgi:SAM-dependent methyltransferase
MNPPLPAFDRLKHGRRPWNYTPGSMLNTEGVCQGDSVPDPVKTTIRSYDKIAEKYCRHTLRDEFRRVEEDFLDRFLAHIGKRAPVIADIGCGDGRDAGYLIGKGATVMLVDLSTGMLAEAVKNVPAGIHLKMDLRALGIVRDCLDGLWASGVLYHLPKSELPAALIELQRVVRPGGLFSFNFKTGTSEGMEKSPRSYPGAPRYYAYYRPGEMRELLSGLFDIVEEEMYPVKAFGDELLQFWCRKPAARQDA